MNLPESNQIASSQDKKANEIIEEIVRAIEDEDKNALKEMFSISAMSEMDAALLDKKIDALFGEWQGEMVEYDSDLSTGINRHNGKSTYFINGFYDIVTTETTHHLLFLSVVRDDENADNIGLSMIVFVTDELYQQEDFYWEYGNRTPGIYIDHVVE